MNGTEAAAPLKPYDRPWVGPTWRERYAAAVARGEFTDDDYQAWKRAETCLVGEQRSRYGVRFDLEVGIPDLQRQMGVAILRNDFGKFGRLLDLVEDRCLAIKRGDV